MTNLLKDGFSEEDLVPLETTYIPDYGNDTPYSAAIMLLAILAYPSSLDFGKRHKFSRAVNSWRVKTALKRGYLTKSQDLSGLDKIPNQQIYGPISRASTRIKKRLQFAQQNGLVNLAKYAKRTSCNQKSFSLTSLIESRSNGIQSKRRIAMRNWSETKPVLHLANALWSELPAISDITNSPDLAWSVYNCVSSAEKWAKSAIQNAENNRLLFTLETRIKPSEQISLIYPKIT